MIVSVFDTKPYDRQYLLAAKGASELTWKFFDFRLSAETVATAKGSQAVCVFVNDKLDRDCIAGLKEAGVGIIALRCAGWNNVDLPQANSCGIRVVRVPAYSPAAVAEHAVALLLTLNRKIHRAYNRVREGNFTLAGLVGFDLKGKTVGIVGAGKIGQAAAQIFRGFGMRVLCYDLAPPLEWARCHQVECVSWDNLLEESDMISLHLPLNTQTHHLINAASILRMKSGCVLINTGRGGLIDTSAAIEGLKKGQLGGMALDVYEEEAGIFFEDHSGEIPMDEKLARLMTFPNVLITSHQGFLTHEALTEIAHITVDNMLCFSRAEPALVGTELSAC